MSPVLISVVIPVYNGEKYIADAIASVLRQGHTPLEIIVVNDGSTDGTLEALAPFGDTIKIVTQENRGQAIARNVGIRRATGSVIGLLDADDLWPDTHISLMLPHLLDGTSDFVRGMTQYVQDLGTSIEKGTESLFLEPLVGACLYNASVFTTVGLFDEEMHHGEDFDWNIRLAESTCREKRLPDTTLLYRRHTTNLTNNKEFVEKGQILAFRKKLKRTKERTLGTS